MALTKHQKLAREIRRMFNALEDHYQQTAAQLSRIQPDFYTTHLGIHYILPEKTRQSLDEAKLEALLTCPFDLNSEARFDWFEREDRAGTLANQLAAIGQYYQERAPFEQNLMQPAFPLFEKAAREYYTKIEFEKNFNILKKTTFAPRDKKITLAECYQLVTASLQGRKHRRSEDFQKFWFYRLRELMFVNLDWTTEQKQNILKEYFPTRHPPYGQAHHVRWKSSLVVHRHTYGAFINYFANRFLENPLKNKADGEISLFLWLAICFSQNSSKIYPIKALLALTTADIIDQHLFIGDEKRELSDGLSKLLYAYTGDKSPQRPQKLFPHLSADRLEDAFRRASTDILPPGSPPALPEAFLVFPHPYKNVRMHPQARQHQRLHPSQVLHDPFPREELKRKLMEYDYKNG
jgi:hypothetical protein